MTDRGPSAEAGWGCGNVGNPGPDRGTAETAGKDCPHFHGPNQKKLFMKSPAGLLRNGKRRTGIGRRQRGVWEAWSIQAPNAKPERSANKDCPPLSMLSALPRTQNARSRINRRQAEVWGRMWSIRAPNAKPECSANKDCPQAFHALRAAANEKRANDPKRQKSGTMSGFIIGSGRIGPGAAPKRQNPHEPSTTRSRRDSTRILTSARYSCLVRRLRRCKPSNQGSRTSALFSRQRLMANRALPPAFDQQHPARLNRLQTICLQALSTTPEPP